MFADQPWFLQAAASSWQDEAEFGNRGLHPVSAAGVMVKRKVGTADLFSATPILAQLSAVHFVLQCGHMTHGLSGSGRKHGL